MLLPCCCCCCCLVPFCVTPTLFHRKSLQLAPPSVPRETEDDESEGLFVTQSWDRHEKELQRAAAQAALQAETNPSRTALHQCFRLLRFITACSALLMGTGQVVGLVTTEKSDIDVLSCVVRAYCCAFCSLVICNEAEYTSMIRNSKILRYWVTRGLLYAFIGCIGLIQNDHATELEPYLHDDTPSLKFIKVVAWLMVAVGATYTILGAFCLKLIDNRVRQDYQERKQRAKHIRKISTKLVDAAAASAAVV